MPGWRLAVAFRRQADGLPVAAGIGADMDAIVAQRSLLTGTEQVGPIVATLATALREVLVEKHKELTEAIETAHATLAGDATWSRLDTTAQAEICQRLGLGVLPGFNVATDSDLRRTLDTRPLAAWRSAIRCRGHADREGAAGSGRVESMQNTPCGVADPADDTSPPRPPRTTTIHVRRGTLPDELAVREWLREQEEKLVGAVRNGPVIVR